MGVRVAVDFADLSFTEALVCTAGEDRPDIQILMPYEEVEDE